MTETAEEPAVQVPTYLYYKDERGQIVHRVCDTVEQVRQLREQGWHSTPAAFGVETHPASPTQLLTPAPVATASSTDQKEVIMLLMQMQAHDEAVAMAVAQLTARVEHLEAQQLPPPSPPPSPSPSPPPHAASSRAAVAPETPDDDEPHTPRRR
jgi:hypothetical protein